MEFLVEHLYLKMPLLHRSSMSPRLTINPLQIINALLMCSPLKRGISNHPYLIYISSKYKLLRQFIVQHVTQVIKNNLFFHKIKDTWTNVSLVLSRNIQMVLINLWNKLILLEYQWIYKHAIKELWTNVIIC